MKEGTIIIGGNSEFMTGLYMMGGNIIVLGDLGEMGGESIVRGTIYVKGDVKTLGKNARITEVDQDDEQWLEKVLAQNNFTSETAKFRKITPVSKRFYYAPTEEG